MKDYPYPDWFYEQQKYKYTIILDRVGSFTGLLTDIIDDEDDYYYEIRKWGANEPFYLSCCGGFIPLIDYLPEKEYLHMKDVWNLNNEWKAK